MLNSFLMYFFQVRSFTAKTVENIVKVATGKNLKVDDMVKNPIRLTQLKCYEVVVKKYRKLCFNVGRVRLNKRLCPTVFSRSHTR